MNLDEIRKMNDYELSCFINSRTQKKEYQVCCKCGKDVYTKKERIGLFVYKGCYCQSFKLCTICNECYTDLLDYLGVKDID